jgi:hypothetical protein
MNLPYFLRCLLVSAVITAFVLERQFRQRKVAGKTDLHFHPPHTVADILTSSTLIGKVLERSLMPRRFAVVSEREKKPEDERELFERTSWFPFSWDVQVSDPYSDGGDLTLLEQILRDKNHL